MANPNNSDDKKNMDTQPSVTEQIRKYIMENLLSVIWSVSLLVGGLIFWVYFFQIQYFPDLSFDESVLLFPLATITGILLLLLMAFIFMLPYFIRCVIFKSVKSSNTEKDEQTKRKTVGELAWFFGSIFVANLALLFFIYQNIIGVITDQDVKVNSFYVFLCLLLINVVFYLSWMKRKGLQLIKRIMSWLRKKQASKNIDNKPNLKCEMAKTDEKIKNEKNMSIFIAWIVSWFISLLSLLILITLIAQIELIEEKEPYEIFLLLAVLFFILMFANFAFAYFREFKERNWRHWLIPFFAVFWLSYIAGDPLIPKMVMRRFHFGNFTAEQFIVEDKGCDILESLYLNPFHVKDQKFCQLINVNILSRLGTTFYIEAMRQKCKAPWRCIPLRLTIPRQYVMSWNTIKPKHKPDDDLGAT